MVSVLGSSPKGPRIETWLRYSCLLWERKKVAAQKFRLQNKTACLDVDDVLTGRLGLTQLLAAVVWFAHRSKI